MGVWKCLRRSRSRAPVRQRRSVGKRWVGKRGRRERPGAYDVSGHTNSRHRRAIGIIVPVPVAALIHWNCPGSESQRGSAPRSQDTRQAFASGCRGEFENPALRYATRVYPGKGLWGKQETPESIVFLRPRWFLGAEGPRAQYRRLVAISTGGPSPIRLQEAYNFGDISQRLILVCPIAKGAYGRRFDSGVIAGNSRPAEQTYGTPSGLRRGPTARFDKSKASSGQSATGSGKTKTGVGPVDSALGIRAGWSIPVATFGIHSHGFPPIQKPHLGPLIDHAAVVR